MLVDFAAQAGRRVRRGRRAMSVCRSCGAPVNWVVTTFGKRMPVDANPDGSWLSADDGNLVLVGGQPPMVKLVPTGEGRLRSHFATCADADDWRKTR